MPHVAAGDDRGRANPARPADRSPSPRSRSGPTSPRPRRIPLGASAAMSSAAPCMAGKSAAMMRRKAASFSWSMAFTSSSLNRPGPQNWAIDSRLVRPKLSWNCCWLIEQSAAARHLHPALIMGMVGIDRALRPCRKLSQVETPRSLVLGETMEYGVRRAMSQGEKRPGWGPCQSCVVGQQYESRKPESTKDRKEFWSSFFRSFVLSGFRDCFELH